jgi:hypothetical protein
LDWDEKAIQACICDGGFFGPDCSQRICPYGDDPATLCQQTYNVEQVQRITVDMAFDMSASTTSSPLGMSDRVIMRGNEFSLSFKTPSGQNYTTGRIRDLWGVQSATYFDAADVAAALGGVGPKSIEAALQGLPNFAVRDVSVTKVAATLPANDNMRSYFDVTFHHLQDKQNNYGVQNLLHCHLPYSCPGPGCQPRVKQSIGLAILQNDGDSGALSWVTKAGMNAGLVYNAGDFAANNFVNIHTDSLLHCPTGVTCGSTGRDTFDAALAVVVVGSATELARVYIKPVGSASHASLLVTDVSTEPHGRWASGAYLDKDTLATKGFLYAGELTSANAAKFDVTDFAPGMFLEFASGVSGTNNVNVGAVVMYREVTCSVRDYSEPTRTFKYFSNNDVENVECSNRGVCDRTTGMCKCHNGYTGAACNVATVLA